MKPIFIIISFLFIVFAVVQYNDPDPLLWILIYAFIAAIFGISAFRKINPKLLIVSMIGFGIACIFYIPGFIDWIREGAPSIVSEMKASTPYIENMREFLGLILCLVLQFYLFKKTR